MAGEQKGPLRELSSKAGLRKSMQVKGGEVIPPLSYLEVRWRSPETTGVEEAQSAGDPTCTLT